MPKGGFGNLIALPLQRLPAHQGNSLFVDDDLRIYQDQWSFLSSLPRLNASHVDHLAGEARAKGNVIGVRPVSMMDGEDDPWTLPPSRKAVKAQRTSEKVPEFVDVVLSDEVYVPKDHLPPALLNEVVRLAAFQNPEFYRAQAMRLPVYGKPRVIGCASDNGKHIGLPRGCRDDLRTLMAEWGVQLRIDDKRISGTAIPVRFIGQLRPEQARASEALLSHDFGILAAGTAFGKTVVAISMLASRAVNTLVIVHRRQLMDQWVERLSTFLDLPREAIGIIGGSKRKPTGCVDVAILQSLCRKGEVDDIIANYGHLIVDECHHISAQTFELVARRCRARYVTGLSATVLRQDGHHPIVIMQCGPIRFRTDARQDAANRPFTHTVEVCHTPFSIPALPALAEDAINETPIQDVFRHITEDETRNVMIAEKALSALRAGRSPVLLTERRQHLDWFQAYLQDKVERLVVLHGGMGLKKRREAWDILQSTAISGAPRLVLATGKYLGEGFDDARLDALLLAMPISWKGTVAQYAGRLHRLYAGKQAVVIYDFVDNSVPVLVRMFERRKRGYASLGYSVVDPAAPNIVDAGSVQ
jgi:superfamily II DNA or RNA helicase